jgi:hypothetical protein
VNADAIPKIITAEARATYPNESSVIGTIEEYPTKADAQKAGEHLQRIGELQDYLPFQASVH